MVDNNVDKMLSYHRYVIRHRLVEWSSLVGGCMQTVLSINFRLTHTPRDIMQSAVIHGGVLLLDIVGRPRNFTKRLSGG